MEFTDPEMLGCEDDASSYSSDNGGGNMDELNLSVNEEIKPTARNISTAAAPEYNPDTEFPTTSNFSPSSASARETNLPRKSILNKATAKYQCGYCTKRFSPHTTRNRHQKSIHLGAKFTCPVCNKDFNDRSVLRRHLRETTCKTGHPPKPKVYKHICHCKLCGTGFVSTTGLQIHLKEAHLRLRSQECDICNKKFIRVWHLSNHRRKVHKLAN